MTIETAWRLFLSSPLIGSGLGYFVEHFPRANGSSLIIHSSYLWVLAELGLVGLAVFGASALGLWRSVWRRVATDDGCQLALLLLAALATMSLVQDMLFQRVTYFILGLALALASARASHVETGGGHAGPAGR
jgi:O-antigen ligase